MSFKHSTLYKEPGYYDFLLIPSDSDNIQQIIPKNTKTEQAVPLNQQSYEYQITAFTNFIAGSENSSNTKKEPKLDDVYPQDRYLSLFVDRFLKR